MGEEAEAYLKQFSNLTVLLHGENSMEIFKEQADQFKRVSESSLSTSKQFTSLFLSFVSELLPNTQSPFAAQLVQPAQLQVPVTETIMAAVTM